MEWWHGDDISSTHTPRTYPYTKYEFYIHQPCMGRILLWAVTRWKQEKRESVKHIYVTYREVLSLLCNFPQSLCSFFPSFSSPLSSFLLPLLSLPSQTHFCLSLSIQCLTFSWTIVPHSPRFIGNQIHVFLKNANCKFWSSVQFLLLCNGSSRLYNGNNFAQRIQLHIYLQLRFHILKNIQKTNKLCYCLKGKI